MKYPNILYIEFTIIYLSPTSYSTKKQSQTIFLPKKHKDSGNISSSNSIKSNRAQIWPCAACCMLHIYALLPQSLQHDRFVVAYTLHSYPRINESAQNHSIFFVLSSHHLLCPPSHCSMAQINCDIGQFHCFV